MGTRGKSSIVRRFHKLFYDSGYKTLSRETGLIPMVYYNDKNLFMQRERKSTFFRTSEVKIIMKMFTKSEIMIFENNSISKNYMRGINEFMMPDVVIIATISIDHILNQGGTLEEVAKGYLDSVPKKTPLIFWTNHKLEYEAFKKICGEMKRKADIIFSPLRDREQTIFPALKKYLDKKKISCNTLEEFKGSGDIPTEIIAKIQNKTFINLGHVNDVLHTALALDEIVFRKKIKKVYFLFNFRSDRHERIFVFINAFIPLFKNLIEGIIIRSDSLPLSADFLKKKIKKKYFASSNIPIHICNDLSDLLLDILPKIPDRKTIVMLGNTADEFGYFLISKLGLFKDTYPIIEKIDSKSFFGFD